jgi:Xaa-Pro aminopeptidase
MLNHPSQCPIQTKLVDPNLLTQAEREWLNSYHAEVLEKVRPQLVQFHDHRAINWLERECAAI